MRVMIDTNVLLSSIIFRSSSTVSVIRASTQGPHELLLSTFVIEEARAVVARKWPKRREALEQYLLQLCFETIVTPLTPEPDLFDIRDPNDYPVLYSAIIGAADVFVTGDKDFVDVDVETPTIMTPAEFERFFSH